MTERLKKKKFRLLNFISLHNSLILTEKGIKKYITSLKNERKAESIEDLSGLTDLQR